MDKSEAIQTLIYLAEGRDGVTHVYNGLCPDVFEGHDIRDEECIVCQALKALQASTDHSGGVAIARRRKGDFQ